MELDLELDVDLENWDFEAAFTTPEVLERSSWPKVKNALEAYGMKDPATRMEGYRNLLKVISERKDMMICDDEIKNEKEEEKEENKIRSETEKGIEEYVIAWLLNVGVLFKQDKVKSVEWWKRSAALGDVDAQYNLGVAYEYAQGAERDIEKAIEWYTKAAEGGDGDATYNLGCLYDGVNDNQSNMERDVEKALAWYNKAAELQMPLALFNLGVIYSEGLGVEVDKRKGLEYYLRGARLGDSKAQYNLGVIYAAGAEGIPQDDVAAVEWYAKAMAQGHKEAKYNLAVHYKNGKGVPVDKKKALQMLQELAQEDKDPDAMYRLSLMYEGHPSWLGFVEVNRRLALEWMHTAALHGSTEACVDMGSRYSAWGEDTHILDEAKEQQWISVVEEII